MTQMAAAERRRAPRVEITDTELSVLEFPIQVRLLDISLGGVLLESTHAVDLGQRGTLRFSFGGAPFSADVCVEHVSRSPGAAAERYAIGAAFVGLNHDGRRVIERFADQ